MVMAEGSFRIVCNALTQEDSAGLIQLLRQSLGLPPGSGTVSLSVPLTLIYPRIFALRSRQRLISTALGP